MPSFLIGRFIGAGILVECAGLNRDGLRAPLLDVKGLLKQECTRLEVCGAELIGSRRNRIELNGQLKRCVSVAPRIPSTCDDTTTPGTDAETSSNRAGNASLKPANGISTLPPFASPSILHTILRSPWISTSLDAARPSRPRSLFRNQASTVYQPSLKPSTT